MQHEWAALEKLADAAISFVVTYSFQILGAILLLVVGLKVADWLARLAARVGERQNFDPTLNRFIGNVVRLFLIALLVIITLGNFGITIAPLVAAIGAAAFGATIAIQGPLANFAAGLTIILTRPFQVGNTIAVRGVSGVVEEITLFATQLLGEDGERITVPNRQIVGEILVNSQAHRVAESRLRIAYDADPEMAVAAVRQGLAEVPVLAGGPAPQVGIDEFAWDGIVLGLRFWAPSRDYFETRYAVNRAVRLALEQAGIRLLPSRQADLFNPPILVQPDALTAPPAAGGGVKVGDLTKIVSRSAPSGSGPTR